MKKIFNLFTFLAAILLATACSPEVDNLFDKSSSQRISEAINKTKDILATPADGWIMHYYGSTMYGGYNVLCKFDKNDRVTVASEVAGKDSTFTSHYKMEQSQGVILSFDEYNDIFHYFSDPHNPDGNGADGKGMLGDLEFRVMKASADSVILKGKKHNSRVVMIPLKKGASWANYIDAVQKRFASMKYNIYDVVIKGKSYRALRSNHTLAFTNPDSQDETRLNFVVTDKGFKLYKPVTIAGETFSEFIYSSDDKWVDANNKNVLLKPIVPPITEQFVSTNWFFAFSNFSAYGQNFWNKLKPGTEKMGENIIGAGLGKELINKDKGPQFGLTFGSSGNGKTYWCQYYFTYKIIGKDQISIGFEGKGNGNAIFYANNAGYMPCVLPFVKIVKGEFVDRVFKLETDNLKNPTYIKFTEVDNPENTFTVSRNNIKDFFAN